MASYLAKRYVHRVSRKMPIGGKEKRLFLSNLKDSVDQYTQDRPDAQHPQLEAEFGTPEEIAADFISQMPYQEINRKFRARTRVVVTALVAAFLIVTIWAMAATIIMNNHFDDGAGYFGDDEITIITTEGDSQ